jgi:hypothetical protein
MVSLWRFLNIVTSLYYDFSYFVSKKKFYIHITNTSIFSEIKKVYVFTMTFISYPIYIHMILASSLRILHSRCSSIVAGTANHYAKIIFPAAWSCKCQRVLHTRDPSSHRNIARRLISRIPMKVIMIPIKAI